MRKRADSGLDPRRGRPKDHLGVTDFWGLEGRGGIAAGASADLVLFDPDTVGANEPVSVHDLPGDCRRFVATATGVEATIVAGHELYRAEEYQGGLPGEVLRNRV